MPADRPWAVGDLQERWNGYLDPSTGILRNVVGARTWDELHRRENAYVEYRGLELLTRPVPQTFDLDHLQVLHRHLFQDVYPWAGELRTVDMGKRAAPGVAGPGFGVLVTVLSRAAMDGRARAMSWLLAGAGSALEREWIGGSGRVQ